jgi:hypothetical protein
MNAFAIPRCPREGAGWTRARISEHTGFDRGCLFDDADDVRKYFRRDVLEAIYPYESFNQGELDEMAAVVIRNRWHMEPSSPGR